MKKSKILFVTGLLLVISAIALSAKYLMPFEKEKELPAAKEELSALTEHWLSQKEYNISGIISLYDGKDSNVIKEQTPFILYKRENSFYTALGSLQTICDGKIFLQVDTVNKYLVIAPVTDSMYANASKNILPVQKMLDDTTGLRITATVKGNDMRRALAITDEHTPEIKNTQVIYQPQDYRITNVIVEWWKNPGMATSTETWVTRMNYEYNAKPVVNVEDKIRSVVTIEKNGTVTVKEQYRDYLVQKEI